jgi:uncharacterized protein YbjT (DUF2867 family)
LYKSKYKYTFVASNFKYKKMKITVTGSLGNISKRLTEQLVKQGHKVTVISHNQDKADAIAALGAKAAIGSIEDLDFLAKAFNGADAVYVMIPPNAKAADLKGIMKEQSDIYAKAIEATGVKYVVNLSGIGGDKPEGNGPSSAFYYSEGRLNQLEDINLLHLRPGMFYTNHYGSVAMVKRAGITGNNFDAETVIAMTHPHDIADAAAIAINGRTFTGKQIQYVVSEELKGGEVAQILADAFGLPNLPWIVFDDEGLKKGITQNGFSEHMAENFAEMGRAIKDGAIWDDYRKNKAGAYGSIKFKDFVTESLVPLYNSL